MQAQVAGGATMLDVNMGAPLIDEPEPLATAVRMIQEMTDLPLCIDSSVVEALEAGLSVYKGKALVNSVTAEDERMDLILPLVKKYGAAIIALPNDEFEIPEEPERRLELHQGHRRLRHHEVPDPHRGHRHRSAGDAHRRGLGHGRPDPRDHPAHPEHVGVNMTLGASNVSFGMPDRHTLNSVFLPMAMTAGLTSAIMDARTAQIVMAVRAADLMMGNDEWGASWIAAHRARQAAAAE